MDSWRQGFTDATSSWFEAAFSGPTPAQVGAWERIGAGRHTLVVAPTGSGKTLAAFLSAVDRLLRPTETERPGTSVLYVSPLKALAVDVERNLRSPLVGISQAAIRLGQPIREVSVGLRSGDTPPAERRRLVSHPPDILITTPESLFLLLTSAARETLTGIDTVIVDEIHAIAGSKRGAHLAVSLERLDELLESPAQRIGLSATVRPHDEVARFLAGRAPVDIVAPPSPSHLELTVEVPVPDMTDLAPRRPAGDAAVREGSTAGPLEPAEPGGSIWPHVESSIVDRVLAARSTIVFANSRGLAERLTARLNEEYASREQAAAGNGSAAAATDRAPSVVGGLSGQSGGAEPVLARAHHGSVSKEQRAVIEDDLKSGRLRCVVATSSLELGIDMGSVDLVLQVGCPPSVASGLQRVGRAGHQVGETSRATIFPLNRHDLLAAAVTAHRMTEGAIEQLTVLANPLDVLAQQTVAACALGDLDVEQWFETVRRSAPFAALPRSAFEATLDLLSGRYPSDEFAELRPRLVWDREGGVLTGRPGAQRLAVTSGGTIPDRGMFAVTIAAEDERSGPRVGELDEEMVYESRVSDVIALGATSWRIQEITHDRVIVTPAFGLPARLPFWRGDPTGRPYELGEAIGAYTARPTPTALDEFARANLGALLRDQRDATGAVPTDTTLVVERFRDELGDWRVALLSPYGREVHAPWALAVAARVEERYGVDGSVVASDDGIVLRVPDTDAEPPGADLFVFEPDELEQIATREVGGSALFAARFRECAARALLLPRRNPGARAPLWQQRRRAATLLEVARKYPTFPILLETARECLQDVYDLPGLARLARRIAARDLTLVEVETRTASPFAQGLMFGYVGQFLYDGDLPLAERRAAALTLDPTMLAELLGRTDLRELLDPDVVARTEAELQHLAPDRRASDLERLADLLRLLGPLSTAEAEERSVGDAAVWLAELATARRVIEVQVAGQVRWAAVEDAARLRDALGTALPLGIAGAHTEPVPDPLGDLVARFARTHGPFTTGACAERLGLGGQVVADTLARLADDGRVLHGEFHPVSTGQTEWVDTEVLRRLRARSLAAARQAIEPVDTSTFARFLPAWQHVGGRLRGVDGVLTVIEQLAPVALPASAWESLVLPSRVGDYSPAMLDELAAAGEVWWRGAGALASGRDGWIQLLPADVVPVNGAEPPAAESPAGRLLAAMTGSGAWLFGQLPAADDTDPPLTETLWELAWAGWVSNDTYAPVRSVVGPGGAHRRRAAPPRARAHRPGRRPARVLTPPSVSGRWYAAPEPPDDDTAAQLERTELALARYGVVTKGSVAAEQSPGGFAAMYRVLRELEQSGRTLRGYFIESLGGAQFAAPGAIDRLRAHERGIDDTARPADAAAVVLAATDPANPFGAALPWPSHPGSHRPGRKAGALVVLHDGHLVLYLERGGRTLLGFDSAPARLTAAAEALVGAARKLRLGRLTVQHADGDPVAGTAVGAALSAAGFEPHPKGLRLDA